MRVVLDTNIIISGLMSLTSPPARILDSVRTGQIVAVMSDATLAELEHVLNRPAVRRYFTHSTITSNEVLADLRLHADLMSQSCPHHQPDSRRTRSPLSRSDGDTPSTPILRDRRQRFRRYPL